jgi:hypothetical protein
MKTLTEKLADLENRIDIVAAELINESDRYNRIEEIRRDDLTVIAGRHHLDLIEYYMDDVKLVHQGTTVVLYMDMSKGKLHVISTAVADEVIRAATAADHFHKEVVATIGSGVARKYQELMGELNEELASLRESHQTTLRHRFKAAIMNPPALQKDGLRSGEAIFEEGSVDRPRPVTVEVTGAKGDQAIRIVRHDRDSSYLFSWKELWSRVDRSEIRFAGEKVRSYKYRPR